MHIYETVWWEGERPGEEWHIHGWTSKNLWVVSFSRLTWLKLHKRRWLHSVTGATCHSRPDWDPPHSPYGLDVAFYVLGAWLLAVQGLHHVAWPWSNQPERPARRTAQRMRRRLAPDADRWLLGLRLALIDLVAPRPIEEILPAGGIPPPEGRNHVTQRSAPVASKLRGAVWIANCGVQSLSISMRRLLGVARRRAAEHLPQ